MNAVSVSRNIWRKVGVIAMSKKVDAYTHYKRRAIKAAKDLGYSEDVICDLENAVNEAEIELIMRRARNGM